MTKKTMYMVYGGELSDPQTQTFTDLVNAEVVGLFKDYEDAYKAWRGAAQRTVDNAHQRYFIVQVDDIQKIEPKE